MGVRASLILGGMILVLRLVDTPLVAVADSPEGQFAIQGRGADRCGAFVDAREARGPELLRYMDWTAGYITAFNQLDDGTVDIVPWQGMDLLATFLAQHCQAHPELSFARAVSEMTKALYGQRLREESAIVSIRTDGGSLPVYDTVVRRMQVALNSLGYYSAEANGKFDEPTRSAIRKFQASEKIKETSLPDQETLYLLFLKAPAASGNDP
jgi:hypothetical protein